MLAFQVAGNLLPTETSVSELVRAEVWSACKREKYFYIESNSLAGREPLQISFFSPIVPLMIQQDILLMQYFFLHQGNHNEEWNHFDVHFANNSKSYWSVSFPVQSCSRW